MPTTISEVEQSALANLCRSRSVRRLDLFGSASTGLLNAARDLDFLADIEAIEPAFGRPW